MLDRIMRADASLTRAMRALPHDPRADPILAACSRATDHAAGWLALGIVGAASDRARRAKWLRGALAAGGAHAAAELVKRAAPRARPQLAGLPPLAATPSPLSFPSAHTASSAAAAHGFRGVLPARALDAAAVVIAFSRPYLGVHYPSDVVAGAALGIVVGRLVAGPP
jgi:membrane-associated phospholipid phosphatase